MKMTSVGAEELTQQSRALDTVPWDPGLIPSTYMAAFNHLSLQPRGSGPFWLLLAHMWQTFIILEMRAEPNLYLISSEAMNHTLRRMHTQGRVTSFC